jgi:hypothetical protein
MPQAGAAPSINRHSMKHSKLLSTSILITSALLLSDVKYGNSQSNQARPNQHKEPTNKHTEATEQAQIVPMVPLAIYQSDLREALRAIHAQEEAAAEEQRSKNEPFNAPSNLIAIGLLIVGAVYSFFAWKQWGAIKEQARIARATLTATRIALTIGRKNAEAAKQAANIAEDALYKTQSAIIYFETTGLSAETGEHVEAIVSYVNLGPMIAYMLRYSLRARIVREFPKLPEYLGEVASYGEVGALLKVDKKYNIRSPVEWPDGCSNDGRRLEVLTEVDAGKWLFMIYGYVIYKDASDRFFKQGFGIARLDGKFSRFPVSEYNYTVRIANPEES